MSLQIACHTRAIIPSGLRYQGWFNPALIICPGFCFCLPAKAAFARDGRGTPLAESSPALSRNLSSGDPWTPEMAIFFPWPLARRLQDHVSLAQLLAKSVPRSDASGARTKLLLWSR